MVLTRTMKELWLFGDLDTLDTQSEAEKQTMAFDEAAVVKGMQQWLDKNAHRLTDKTDGPPMQQ